MSQSTRRALRAVSGLALLLWIGLLWLGAGSAGAQQSPTTSVPVPQTVATTAAVSPTTTQSADLDAQIDMLELEIEQLQDDQANDRVVFWGVLGPVALLVGLLTAGGVVGIITSLRNDHRSGQVHELLVAGESAAQARGEQSHATFLDASQKTLGLVNDTLELAKDASERAVTTMSDKARRHLRLLDTKALDVIREAASTGKCKKLVDTPKLKTDILNIATELQAIEGFLALQDIDMTPACLFIRGIERHLHQEPTSATNNLQRAIDESDDDNLKILAYYWIGYEQNNLGQHDSAMGTFHRAVGLARRTNDKSEFDLRAMEYESQFFDIAKVLTSKADDGALLRAIRAAEDLATQIQKDVDELSAGSGHAESQAVLLGKMGNIRTWQSAASRHSAGAAGQVEAERRIGQAIEAYRKAHDWEQQASSTSWYTRFGLLEALAESESWQVGASFESGFDELFDLGRDAAESDVAREQQLAHFAYIEGEVQREMSRRTEPRSLVLLEQTRLICMFHQGKSEDQLAAAMQDLQKQLGGVRDEVTLFSQFKKCNVGRAEFDSEIRRRFEDFKQRRRALDNGGTLSDPGPVPQ